MREEEEDFKAPETMAGRTHPTNSHKFGSVEYTEAIPESDSSHGDKIIDNQDLRFHTTYSLVG
jgi:hypothetical protein